MNDSVQVAAQDSSLDSQKVYSPEAINLIFLGREFDSSAGRSLFAALEQRLASIYQAAALGCRYFYDVKALIKEMTGPGVADSRGQLANGVNLLVVNTKFISDFMDQHLFYEINDNDGISDEELEEIARHLHDTSASILILSSEEKTSLASDAMSIGRKLGIAVDGVMESTPDALLVEKLHSLIVSAVQNRETTEQSSLVEETNNHLIREQEVAKAVFEKVASEHRIDLPCVRQWLSPIAVFNGDVFMAAPTPKQDLLVLLGDFTGHGLGAALGAIPLASTFYRMAGKGFSLKDIVVEINKRLHESLPTGFFCCALVAKIDFQTGSLEYLNAGLPDCYWLKQKNGELQPLVSSALPLGILPPSQFEVDLHRLSINHGDYLFMLSDGLLESENSHGEAFGTHRMIKSINNEYIRTRDSSESSNFLAAIESSVRDFRGANDRFDDISFAEIEIVDFDSFKNSYTPTVDRERQSPSEWKMSYRFGAKSLQNKDPIPQILNLLLDEPGLRVHAGTVFSILSELYNNALDHGVLQLESTIKDAKSGFSRFYEQRAKRLEQLQEGEISFDISYEACAKTGCLNITVEDSGQGFDWYKRVNKAGLESEAGGAGVSQHGRGIPLLKQLCDHISYSGRGNNVKAVFSWDMQDSEYPEVTQRKTA